MNIRNKFGKLSDIVDMRRPYAERDEHRLRQFLRSLLAMQR